MENNIDNTDLFAVLSADNILRGSVILSQVLDLRNTLSRNSEGELINYDDMALRIQSEVDDLTTLQLDMNLASGSEGAYQRQLIFALEKIYDDYDRVLIKISGLKSRLVNAQSLLDDKFSQFAAFYSLALGGAIKKVDLSLKLSVDHVKKLAKSEFTRLVDSLDNLVPSLISELEILEDKVRQEKKTQQEKYQLGKDQVNALWNSIQSVGNKGISLDEASGKLVKKQQPTEVEVEEFDDIPSYVSKISKEVRVAANPNLKPATKPDDEIKGTFVKYGDHKPVTTLEREWSKNALDLLEEKPKDKPQPLLAPYDDFCLLDTDCSICGKQQFNAPSGVICPLGHGGADGVERNPVKLEISFEGVTLRNKPIEDIESFMNEEEPLATPAPSTPRKKLTIMEDDEDL